MTAREFETLRRLRTGPSPIPLHISLGTSTQYKEIDSPSRLRHSLSYSIHALQRSGDVTRVAIQSCDAKSEGANSSQQGKGSFMLRSMYSECGPSNSRAVCPRNTILRNRELRALLAGWKYCRLLVLPTPKSTSGKAREDLIQLCLVSRRIRRQKSEKARGSETSERRTGEERETIVCDALARRSMLCWFY